VIAKNRTMDYQKTIATYKILSKKKQLLKVNFYLNQVDHWAGYTKRVSLGWFLRL